MPNYFHFHEQNKHFDGKLESLQCLFIKVNGEQCLKHCVIGLPFCCIHTKIAYKLVIKPSTIPDAGLGVFVQDNKLEPNAIVFKKGQLRFPYYGKVINEAELIDRYGGYTAPYGIKLNKGLYEDGALMRGIGTLVNHQTNARSNCKFALNPKTNLINITNTKALRSGEELFVNYGRIYRFNEQGVSTSTNRKKFNL